MTRTRTLFAVTVLAGAIPFAAAVAQTASGSCGPESWSTAKMAYTKTPCNAGDATAQVGTSGPTAYGSGSSSSMTKAEMKQSAPYGYAQPGYAPMPMQNQAVLAGSADAPMMGDQSCGASNAVAITDEYHRKYNCRGDRIR
jgi:hypothetical protein